MWSLLVSEGTGRVYNALTHHCVSKLEGHEGEISKVSCNYNVSFVNILFFIVWKFFFLEVNRKATVEFYSVSQTSVQLVGMEGRCSFGGATLHYQNARL